MQTVIFNSTKKLALDHFSATRYSICMPNRYLCDVLDEMRECYKTRNFSYLKGLIEEAQTLGERMEAALGDKKDYNHWYNKKKEEEAEFNTLRKEADKLRVAKGEKPKGKERRYGVYD